MPEPLSPEPALTFGRENWYYVPAGGLANPLAPTAAELSAASVLDFTNMAFQDGTEPVTQSTNRVEANRRIGQTTTYERKGATQRQGGTISYSIRPQDMAGANGKKAYEKFLGGPDGGHLVQRLDVPTATAPTTGQFVNVYPADLGPSLVGKVGDGEAGEVAGTCDYFIRSAITQLVALG